MRQCVVNCRADRFQLLGTLNPIVCAARIYRLRCWERSRQNSKMTGLLGSLFASLAKTGPEGRDCGQTLLDDLNDQCQLHGEGCRCHYWDHFIVLPGRKEMALGRCFQQEQRKQPSLRSRSEGGGWLMTPSFPVFLGLGDVPSLSTRYLFFCQAGGSRRDLSGAVAAASALSSVWDLPPGAGKSGQTKLSCPVTESGIP